MISRIQSSAAPISALATFASPGRAYKPWYNVKEYNAKGDNVTDDTAAIQAGINDVISKQGGILFFPPGIYRISATLTIVGNYCTLMGPYYSRDYTDYPAFPVGNSYDIGMSTIKVLASFPANSPMVVANTSGSIWYTMGGGVERLCLSGGSNPSGTGGGILAGNGIEQYNAHDFKVRDVVVEQLNGKGVYAKGTLPGGVSQAEVDNCLIRSTGGYGVHYDSGMIINRITRNFISGIAGIGIYNQSNNNYVLDNHLEGPNFKSADVSVSGSGIVNLGAAVTITGNEVVGCDYHGIWNSNAGFASTINNNKVEQPNQGSHGDGSGIYFSDGGTQATTCIGNTCYDNSSKMVYGIFDHTSVGPGVHIDANSLYGFTTKGIGVSNPGKSSIGFNNGSNPRVEYAQGNVTGATTFNRQNGDVITATLTGNITVTLTAAEISGDTLTLILTQDGTGTRTVSWPSNFKKAGGALVLTITAGAVDVIKMAWDGTNWREVARSLNES